MLESCKLTDGPGAETKVIAQLEKEFEEAIRGSDGEAKLHAVMKLAALFITLPGFFFR